jgi:hypothetical protein
MVNAERRGKRQVLIRPSSKVIVKFLSVMQRHGEYCVFVVFLCHILQWYNFTPEVITTIDAVIASTRPLF